MQEALMDFKKFINDAVGKVFPGANYAIIINDQVYLDSVGEKSIYPLKEMNNINTKYDIAALTMVVVTVPLTQIMIEKNKISLYDKVVKYLPNYINEDITILQLLTHTSGLQADINTDGVLDRKSLLDIIYNLRPIEKSDKYIIYSEINFLILGLILEVATGKTLDVLAKMEFFNKLDMRNTSYNPIFAEECAPTEIDYHNHLLRGEVHDVKARLLQGVAGHDGIFMDINDISKYIQMLLNNGVYNNKQILNSKFLEAWFWPLVSTEKGYNNQIPDPTVNGEARSLGFICGKSYSTGNYVSKTTISHNGFTGCTIMIDKENNLGFALLSNRVHPNSKNKEIYQYRPQIINKLYELFINNRKEDNNE